MERICEYFWGAGRSVSASGRETVTETAFDTATGILTSVSQTESSTPVTARSIYGVTLGQTSIDGASVMSYDSLGRIVSTGGDTYPLLSGFDSAGRKTRGSTTRDGGATWDETRWEFDPASGVNTAKEYADGSRVSHAHTDNGQKTRTTWARGAWRENAYNARNLVSGTAYSDDTPSIAYTYALRGEILGLFAPARRGKNMV